MSSRPSSARPGSKTSRIVAIAVAASLMLALTLLVSRLVVLWCPRGADCEQTAQMMFWIGLLVSAAVAVSGGLVTRDVLDRWRCSGQP